jgi:WD40 repeat protein
MVMAAIGMVAAGAIAPVGAEPTAPLSIVQAAPQPNAAPSITLPIQAHRLALSPDGKHLAAVLIQPTDSSRPDSHVVELWDWRSGKRLHQLGGHQDLVMQVLFSPDGQTLATLDYQIDSHRMVVRLWDVATGERLRSITRTLMPLPMCGPGQTVGCGRSVLLTGAFSPDGRTLYTSGVSHLIDVWDVASGRRLRSFAGPRAIGRGMALSPDGQTLALSYWGGQMALFDAAKGQLRDQWQSSGESIALRWSPDGRQLIGMTDAPADNGTGRLVQQWGFAPEPSRQILVPLQHSSLWAAISDRWVITGRIDMQQGRPIALLDRATGRTVRQIQPANGYLHFTASDRALAVSTEQSVQIWVIDP